MAEAVIDSSVLLAILLDEPGAAVATALALGAVISAVNVAEVMNRMTDKNRDAALVQRALNALAIETESFDLVDALAVGKLREATRHAGLSLGDRACLALAQRLGTRVYTGDRQWMTVDVGLHIELIR